MKKLFSFIICMLLCMSLAIPVSALESADVASVNDSGISPYPFNRTYKHYFTSGKPLTIVEDPNYDVFADTYVSISFIESTGPTEVSVTLLYKNNDQGDWIISSTKTLSLGNATMWTIPENSCFYIRGTLTSGENGYATFRVILDDGS